MTPFRQGDIVEVDFNPTRGHEPQNKRPAVVCSNDHFNMSTSMAIVCPITSRDNRFFLHEPLAESCPVDGVVAMEQLRAIDLKARKAKRISHMEPEQLAPILTCLQSFFSE